MINELPKTSNTVFATNTDALRKSFQKQRKLRLQAEKPKTAADMLLHLPPLESNYGIPQDKRYPSRYANARPQKHQQHPGLHETHRLQRRRIHRTHRPLRTRSLPTHRIRLRIRLRFPRKQNLQKNPSNSLPIPFYRQNGRGINCGGRGGMRLIF
jgi:hypothetical protein